MKFRSIDGNGDWNFGKGLESYAIDNNAIALDVQTSVLSFLKDCWFRPDAGIDWLRLLGSKNTELEIQLTIRGIILQRYGVTKVNFVNLVFNGRRLTISYSMDTIFSNNNSQIVEVI